MKIKGSKRVLAFFAAILLLAFPACKEPSGPGFASVPVNGGGGSGSGGNSTLCVDPQVVTIPNHAYSANPLYVIRSQSDWQSYCAGLSPVPLPPVDLNNTMILAYSQTYTSSCQDHVVFQKVCFTDAEVTEAVFSERKPDLSNDLAANLAAASQGGQP